MDCGCATPDEAFRGLEEDSDMPDAEDLRCRARADREERDDSDN